MIDSGGFDVDCLHALETLAIDGGQSLSLSAIKKPKRFSASLSTLGESSETGIGRPGDDVVSRVLPLKPGLTKKQRKLVDMCIELAQSSPNTAWGRLWVTDYIPVIVDYHGQLDYRQPNGESMRSCLGVVSTPWEYSAGLLRMVGLFGGICAAAKRRRDLINGPK